MAGRTSKQAPERREQSMGPEDKRVMRRRRARRRAILRSVILVVLCVGLFLLWQNWNALAPDRLMGKLQDLVGSGTGSYPVDVSGTGVRRLARSQNYSVVLTDSHLTYLNQSGAEVARYSCTYPSALLRTAGRYVLLAEQSGQRLQVCTRTAILTELTADQDIISVALNEKGQFAVLTQGPQGYAVQVKVYDRNGKELYSRSRNQTATDVALAADGSQIALLSVQAADGNLNTSVEVFSLETADTGALCSYTASDSLLYRLEYLDGGWLAALGETGVVMMDTANGLTTVYAPTGMRLLGYAVGGEDLALALRPYGTTGDGQIQVIDKHGEPRSTVPFTGDFRHLSGQEQQYVLLTDSYVQKITAAGAAGTADVAADGQQAVLDGENAVVLGLNRLESYPLS